MPEAKEQSWPQVGDSLFGDDGASERTHVMLYDPFADGLLAYALVYRQAADQIVEAVQAGRAHPDSVSYSVLYLYRHYLELMLKGLIGLGTALEEGSERYPTEHRIEALWAKLRPFLERAFPKAEKPTTDAVEAVIKELAMVDPDGQATRYHERCRKNKLGQRVREPSIAQTVHLDLENVRRVINRIAGFLEGSYDAMDDLLNYQVDVHDK